VPGKAKKVRRPAGPVPPASTLGPPKIATRGAAARTRAAHHHVRARRRRFTSASAGPGAAAESWRRRCRKKFGPAPRPWPFTNEKIENARPARPGPAFTTKLGAPRSPSEVARRDETRPPRKPPPERVELGDEEAWSCQSPKNHRHAERYAGPGDQDGCPSYPSRLTSAEAGTDLDARPAEGVTGGAVGERGILPGLAEGVRVTTDPSGGASPPPALRLVGAAVPAPFEDEEVDAPGSARAAQPVRGPGRPAPG